MEYLQLETNFRNQERSEEKNKKIKILCGLLGGYTLCKIPRLINIVSP